MNVYILNTIAAGLDTISLINKPFALCGIIGLSHREPTDQISDYVYQADFCAERKLSFIEVDSYGLTKEADRKKLLALDIDVLVVAGWQRLVPEWLINHCKVGVIGSHGSPLGITKGRGRSPQNWALMLGLDTFYISIFKIDSGIDSGQIIDTRSFRYSEFDDIKTSYYKTCLLTANMIVENLSDPNFATRQFKEQDEHEAAYFPQRLPSDGKLDWTRSNAQIRDFVRALNRPYPGAESTVDGISVKIWSVIPFDIDVAGEYEVGTIVRIFNKGDLLVRTHESFVLVDEYSVLAEGVKLSEGACFESVSFSEQMNVIIERHETKYPDLPISDQIKGYEGE